MTCPTREELVAVLDGALAPDALAKARRHVGGCDRCRAELARLEAGVALLRAGSPAVEPSPFFATRLAARLAAEPPRRRGLSFYLGTPWRLAAAGVQAAPARAEEPAATAPSPGARERFESLSPEQREALRERWRQFQALPPERQAELRGRLERLRSLPPERREQVMRNWEAFQRLPVRERREILDRFQRFREMSPERRAQLRQALRQIVEASPRERARYLDNLRRWREMSPAERDRAREEFRQRRLRR